jgi:hypothetical protein
MNYNIRKEMWITRKGKKYEIQDKERNMNYKKEKEI